MPDQSAEYRETFKRFLEFHEAYISTHIAKIKCENDPQRQSVAAVIPLWDRLDNPPLRYLAAMRMVELLKEAMSSGQLQYAVEVSRDCFLIVSVAPAYHASDVRECFGPDGYARFTLNDAGAADAVANGQWVAHWTLCTDGSRSPIVHLSVLPSGRMLNAGPALMLWAQDLFSSEEWRELPDLIEDVLPSSERCEQSSIHDLATKVAQNPESWDEAVASVRRPDVAASTALTKQLDQLKRAVHSRILLTPEPIGFLAAALSFEFVRGLKAIDHDFVRDVGLWAVAHSVNVPRLMPIRLRLLQSIHQGIRRTDNPQLWAGLQQAAGNAYLMSNPEQRTENLDAAIKCFRSALEVFTLSASSVPWAITQHSLGTAYLEIAKESRPNEIESAIRCFHSALEVRTKDAMPNEWADSTVLLGACLLNRNLGERGENHERALQCHLDTLSVYSHEESPVKWAMAYDSLGTLYCNRIGGDRVENIENAIRCYREALRVRTPVAMPTDWAMTMNNLGTAFDDRIRGDRAENKEEAIRCFRAALTNCGDLASPRQLAIRANNLGNSFLDRIRGDRAENIEEAINWYQRALAARTRYQMPIELAITQNCLGHAYIQRMRGNRADNLEKAITHLTASLSVCNRETMPAEWAQTRNNLGNAYRDRSEGISSRNLAMAAERYREAAEVFEKLGVRREAVRSYRNLGRLEIERKNWGAACLSLETAAELLEGELAQSQTEVGRLSWLREQSGVYDGLVAANLLAQQYDESARSGKIARACYWAERSRARYLADLMAAGERPPDGIAEETYELFRSTVRRVRDLDQRLEAAERKRAALGLENSQRTQLEQEIAAFQAQRAEAYGNSMSLRDRFAESDHNWTAGAKALSVESMREVARDANAALLTLRPSQWGTSVIFILPNGKVAGGILKSLTLSQVQELLAHQNGGAPDGGWMVEYSRYRSAPDALYDERTRRWHQELEHTLGKLGEWLWQPLRKWLEKVYPRSEDPDCPKPLVILPSLGLNILPLHACWWQEGDNRHWACDEYQITYAPSIWVLHRCLAKQAAFRSLPQRLLAVRNPTGDLQWANWEADSVCRLLPNSLVLGSQSDKHPASRKRLKEELPRSPLALLCTHATYEISDPWTGTGLCTADAAKDNPIQPCLTLADIFDLKLSNLWLAVLSACESGISDYRDPAGEQMGLPAALLAAGVITVAGSLWVVDDLATALLSHRFFWELFGRSDDQEITKGLALWRAQKWLRSLTREELVELTGALPRGERTHFDRDLRSSRDMVRVSHEGTLPSAARPYEHPAFWSAFACYGAP